MTSDGKFRTIPKFLQAPSYVDIIQDRWYKPAHGAPQPRRIVITMTTMIGKTIPTENRHRSLRFKYSISYSKNTELLSHKLQRVIAIRGKHWLPLPM